MRVKFAVHDSDFGGTLIMGEPIEYSLPIALNDIFYLDNVFDGMSKVEFARCFGRQRRTDDDTTLKVTGIQHKKDDKGEYLYVFLEWEVPLPDDFEYPDEIEEGLRTV